MVSVHTSNGPQQSNLSIPGSDVVFNHSTSGLLLFDIFQVGAAHKTSDMSREVLTLSDHPAGQNTTIIFVISPAKQNQLNKLRLDKLEQVGKMHSEPRTSFFLPIENTQVNSMSVISAVNQIMIIMWWVGIRLSLSYPWVTRMLNWMTADYHVPLSLLILPPVIISDQIWVSQFSILRPGQCDKAPRPRLTSENGSWVQKQKVELSSQSLNTPPSQLSTVGRLSNRTFLIFLLAAAKSMFCRVSTFSFLVAAWCRSFLLPQAVYSGNNALDGSSHRLHVRDSGCCAYTPFWPLDFCLQNLDSGNDIQRAVMLCTYLSYTFWLHLLTMEQWISTRSLILLKNLAWTAGFH